MAGSDIDYYRARAIFEREMALKSTRRDVAAIHEELARNYQARIDQAEQRPKLRIAASTSVPDSQSANA